MVGSAAVLNVRTVNVSDTSSLVCCLEPFLMSMHAELGAY